jgi:hypothetical protein
MSDMGPWTNEDFESLSWHDVHVHGFRFEAFDENEGCADLVLDIDYILKWDKSGDAFSFLISQANLRFHKVFGFKFELDYASPTAGMSPFSLDRIERKLFEAPNGYKSYRWHLRINWPNGNMEFDAHVQPGQWLGPEKRDSGPAA